MSKWKEYKLGEIVAFGNGKGRPKEKGTIPVYGGNGILDFTNDSNYDGETVIIGRVGAYCGSVYYTNIPIWVSDNALAVKTKEGNDTKFIYYYLHHLNLNDYAEGSSHPLVTQRLLNSIDIKIPTNLTEQKRIASILSSLDDKIDLLNRENTTLEAMAETLFRQWFIEEAKEDWEEVPLEYVCEKITDGSHYSPESVEFGIPMASVKDMEDWGINLNSCRKISKEDYKKLLFADCLPQVNDILIAKDGSYLKHIFVVDKIQKVVILSSIAIIRPNGLYHPYLLSILLKLDSTKEELNNIVTGAVIPRIVLKDFRKFPILLPPKEKQTQALAFIEPIMRKCFSNRGQIQTLIQTRDILLPKLMSNEIVI